MEDWHYTCVIGDGEKYVHIDMLYGRITVEDYTERNDRYKFLPTLLIYVKDDIPTDLYKLTDFK